MILSYWHRYCCSILLTVAVIEIIGKQKQYPNSANNYRFVHALSAASSSSPFSGDASSSSSTTTSSSSWDHKIPLHGTKPDPFVLAAPLIVAVVCQDGVAVIAAHTPADEEEDDEDEVIIIDSDDDDDNNVDDGDDGKTMKIKDRPLKKSSTTMSNLIDPLLYYRPTDKKRKTAIKSADYSRTARFISKEDDDDYDYLSSPRERNNKKNNDDADDVMTDEDDGSISFLDLPENYGGPYRIHPLIFGGRGVAGSADAGEGVLLACGWRADCHTILDQCHTTIDNERRLFGRSTSTTLLYGDQLATDLSFYMAQCAVSDRVRALSCAALLVSPAISGNSNNKSSTCGLWLVDSTGSYRLRAHCIGGGLLPKDIVRISSDGTTTSTSKEEEVQRKQKTTVSDYINQRLLKEYFTSTSSSRGGFEDITAEEGLKRLVLILANKEVLDNNIPPSEDSDPAASISRCMRPPTKPILRPKTRLELAIIITSSGNSQQQPKFIRKTLADLFIRTATTRKSSSPRS